MAADTLVLTGPLWPGDDSSVTKQVIERLYGCSRLLDSRGSTPLTDTWADASSRRAGSSPRSGQGGAEHGIKGA